MILPVVFAVVAAGSNAVGTVLQRRAALEVPDSSARLGLVRHLLRSPLWFGGILGVVASALFQVLALSTGTLAVVQPVFVLELPPALLVGGAVFHVRVSRRTWSDVVCIFVGLAVALFSSFPSGGRSQVPGLWWPPALVAFGGAGTVLVLAGLRRPHGLARAAHLAAAAVIGNALTAALVKSAMDTLTKEGVPAFFLAWQTYGFAAVGAPSLYLLGYVMRGGPLTASQPAFTLGDATVSFSWASHSSRRRHGAAYGSCPRSRASPCSATASSPCRAPGIRRRECPGPAARTRLLALT
ncbi:DMT family transporter [Streptomyces sp. NPDC091217]|uniref:DMT family transporter n=1 Tax=Streptomyces sp. NPDC091217 TaxID=3365975 RepID=UPI0038159644